MKITLITTVPERLTCRLPYEGAKFVEVESLPACPCTPGAEGPLQVCGGQETVSHSIITAPAGCPACGKRYGVLEVDLSGSTLFGIEEDRAMMGPGRRWRVY